MQSSMQELLQRLISASARAATQRDSPGEATENTSIRGPIPNCQHVQKGMRFESITTPNLQ